MKWSAESGLGFVGAFDLSVNWSYSEPKSPSNSICQQFSVISSFQEFGERCYNVTISWMVDGKRFLQKSRDELPNIFDNFHYWNLKLYRAVSKAIWICCFCAEIIMQTRNETFWHRRYLHEIQPFDLLLDILFSLWIVWTIANFVNCVKCKKN
jgi:hypothetical protein